MKYLQTEYRIVSAKANLAKLHFQFLKNFHILLREDNENNGFGAEIQTDLRV